MQLRAYLKQQAGKLEAAGIESALLDAQLLYAHALGLERQDVLLQQPDLNPAQQQLFDSLMQRRMKREPLSHILGGREFYGRQFVVNSDVLDPRPDTETLIDAMLLVVNGDFLDGGNSPPLAPPAGGVGIKEKAAHGVGMKENATSGVGMKKDAASGGEIPLATSNYQLTTINQRPTFLDIGTGSGCIIITLLKEIPNATGVGLDISAKALAVAARNAKRHNVLDRLQLIQASMFELDNKNNMLSKNRFDVIVSNPPYIRAGDMAQLMPEVQHYEPHLALDGGKDGLDCYRVLAKSAGKLLKPEGLFFLEIGAGQANDVADIFRAANWQLIDIRNDLNGHERCVIFKQL